MKEKKEEQQRIRKEWKHGVITQKMVSFKCDLENVDWLDCFQNKGRYINDLIAADRRQKSMGA